MGQLQSQINSLVNKRSATALRERINTEFPIELPVKFSDSVEFGYLDVAQRFKLIATYLWLLHDWPYRLMNILREVRQSRSRVTEDPDGLPYWLSTPLNQFLDQRVYVPSYEEFMSAKKYLILKGGATNTNAMADLLGVGTDYIRSIVSMN